jgi:glycosyltransferase involved in cell wall biosynthesis
MVARGIPRERITIVPNGIDPTAFGEPVRDGALRRQLGLEDRFAVGYVGNLDHWREGMDVLISSIADLHRRGRTEVAGLIVGDGSGREDLEAYARRIGIADHVRFTGRVPHDVVPSYYAQFDLFTNPRVEERAAHFITPLKPYEAMALGRPLLVSDLPALAEIVDPPHRGHVATAGDPIALADAIEALMDDPAERERIANAGRDWVRTQRTWASNGPRYRRAYERVLGPLG